MPVKLNSVGGGSVTMDAANTASTFTLTLPAATGTVALTASPSFTGNITTTGNISTSGGTVSDSKGDLRQLPVNNQTTAYALVVGDAGKTISITTGGVTVNSGIFSAGDNITIFNNSASNQTITQGSSVTIYLAGTLSTGNRTLASYGVCTLLCVASNTFTISGAGLT